MAVQKWQKVGGDQIHLVPMISKGGGTRPTGPVGWLRGRPHIGANDPALEKWMKN